MNSILHNKSNSLPLNYNELYRSLEFYNYDVSEVCHKDENNAYPELSNMVLYFINKEEYDKVIILEWLIKQQNSK